MIKKKLKINKKYPDYQEMEDAEPEYQCYFYDTISRINWMA